jgi:hypothetical protein
VTVTREFSESFLRREFCTGRIGQQIADTANRYGLDILNVLILTPLPGTCLWKKMESEDRITANNFPEDWKYYTLNYPVARYQNLSWSDLDQEGDACSRDFYSYPRIISRVCGSLWRTRKLVSVLASLVSNLSYRSNELVYRDKREGVNFSRGETTNSSVMNRGVGSADAGREVCQQVAAMTE